MTGLRRTNCVFLFVVYYTKDQTKLGWRPKFEDMYKTMFKLYIQKKLDKQEI